MLQAAQHLQSWGEDGAELARGHWGRGLKIVHNTAKNPICYWMWLYENEKSMPFGQLISQKIVKIVATRGQILRLKCIISLGAVPHAGGAYSAPQN